MGETIREEIQPINLPPKKNTNFGVFLNGLDSQSDGGDATIIPTSDLKKNLNDNLKKEVKNKLDKKDKLPKSDKKDKKDKSGKKSDRKDKKDKKGDAKDLIIQNLQKELQELKGS